MPDFSSYPGHTCAFFQLAPLLASGMNMRYDEGSTVMGAMQCQQSYVSAGSVSISSATNARNHRISILKPPAIKLSFGSIPFCWPPIMASPPANSTKSNALSSSIRPNSWRYGMTTSAKTNLRATRAYVPTTALAKAVSFDDAAMHVTLTDGRILSVPLIWFPLLHAASPDQRNQYEIGAGGRSLHWPEIDEDLSVAQLLAGADQTAI